MALVLTRFLEQSVIINDNIEIKIVRVKGKQVRLLFDCPTNVTIDRKETHAENKEKRKNSVRDSQC